MTAAAAARAHERSFSFVARDIATAVADIRAKLGSEAVVLDIRRLLPRGLTRLWQQPRVEIIACLPEPEETPAEPDFPPAPPPPPFAIPRQTAMQRYASAAAATAPEPNPASAASAVSLDEPSPAPPNEHTWRCAAVLERLGLTPVHVEQVLEQMQQLHGVDRRPPESMTQELVLARAALLRCWRPRPTPPPLAGAPLHVFIGPPGVGKSTALCKWLAQTVLLDAQAAQVWRLDGRTANTSEIVNLYGEILGVRVERRWNGRGEPLLPGFVDLPSVDFQDAEALPALGQTLGQFPGAQVHLVLNAAYSTPLLLAQARAFAGLPVTDLILTHLDEETSWGKLWNLVLGTNCPLGFLSAGQNIPGRFSAAQAEQLCGPLFGGK